MPGTRYAAVCLVLGLSAGNVVTAQVRKPNVDPEAVPRGKALYSKLCAGCHGMNARGGDGPDLYRSNTVRLGSERTLSDLLRNGIPGTAMVPYSLPEGDIGGLVAYLHSLTRPGLGPPVAGDTGNGGRLFEQSGCPRCHMIGGKGGVTGPDLSSVALRLGAEEIRRSVADPGARIAEGHQTVRVRLDDGSEITGLLKNEDNFSLQILRADGEYALLDRARTRSVTMERGSLMPAGLAARLTAGEFQDLLAFLDRQRAPFLRFTTSFQNY